MVIRFGYGYLDAQVSAGGEIVIVKIHFHEVLFISYDNKSIIVCEQTRAFKKCFILSSTIQRIKFWS